MNDKTITPKGRLIFYAIIGDLMFIKRDEFVAVGALAVDGFPVNQPLRVTSYTGTR